MNPSFVAARSMCSMPTDTVDSRLNTVFINKYEPQLNTGFFGGLNLATFNATISNFDPTLA